MASTEIPVDPGALADEIARTAAHLAAGTHRLLACIRAFDESGEWGHQGMISCAHWLTWRIRLAPGAAREKVRVARALGTLPHIDDALRRGELSYSQVRALTRVATAANEQDMVMVARSCTAAQLERLCRRIRRAVDVNEQGDRPDEHRGLYQETLENGMVRLTVVLHADEAALVMKAVEHARHPSGPGSVAVASSVAVPSCPVEDQAARRRVSAETASSPPRSAATADRRGGSSLPAAAVESAAASLPAVCANGAGGSSPRSGGSADVAESSPTSGASAQGGDATSSCSACGESVATAPQSGWCEEEAAVSSPANASAETRPRLCPRPDALVAVAVTYLAHHDTATRGGPRTQIVVHLDQDPLASDGTVAATLDDGTRVSAEAFRRLSCDASVLPVRHTASGPQLDLGRRTRTISPALRRALALRDRGCAFPACPNDRFLHAHHLQHWAHGGPTTLDNLVHVCTHHHRLLHEGGFHASRNDRGELVFIDPRGQLVGVVPVPHDLRDDPRIGDWTDHAGLELDAQTGFPGWDGERIDYQWAVDALARGRLLSPTDMPQ